MKIIIPAYEPDKALLKLIKEIKENSAYDIILVDDGSSPECNPIFIEAVTEGCILLKHENNQGKGAALKTAFSYILQENSYILQENSYILQENSYKTQCLEDSGFVCADCDGQHTWPDIKKIADAIPLHKSSVILGCRKFVGSVPLKSLIGNKLTRGIFSLVSGTKITDTQTGLRGFSTHMLPWLLQLKGNHYEFEMNQLLEAKTVGYDFYSIPINTIYENNNISSHFHPIKDSIRIYLPIFKFSLSSIISGVIDFLLLLLLNKLSDNLLLSVVLARVISSFCNYLLNKNMVFESKDQNQGYAILKYYLLASGILICNYFLISFFNSTIDLSLVLSKLLTEIFLFSISYFIQRKFIFI